MPTFLNHTVPVPGQPLTFQTKGVGRPNDVTLIPFYQATGAGLARFYRMAISP